MWESRIDGKRVQAAYVQTGNGLKKVRDFYDMTENGLKRWAYSEFVLVRGKELSMFYQDGKLYVFSCSSDLKQDNIGYYYEYSVNEIEVWRVDTGLYEKRRGMIVIDPATLKVAENPFTDAISVPHRMYDGRYMAYSNERYGGQMAINGNKICVSSNLTDWSESTHPYIGGAYIMDWTEGDQNHHALVMDWSIEASHGGFVYASDPDAGAFKARMGEYDTEMTCIRQPDSDYNPFQSFTASSVGFFSAFGRLFYITGSRMFSVDENDQFTPLFDLTEVIGPLPNGRQRVISDINFFLHVRSNTYYFFMTKAEGLHSPNTSVVLDRCCIKTTDFVTFDYVPRSPYMPFVYKNWNMGDIVLEHENYYLFLVISGHDVVLKAIRK